MKICIIGLGSIGTRHINNIHTLLSGNVHIDALRSSNRLVSHDISKLINREYRTLDEMPDDYDIIFITNPTSLHYETIAKTVSKTRHMFVEKPVFDNLNYDIAKLHLKTDSIYYVACPLRYTRVVEYIKEFVQNNKIYAARGICSSYLPEWRPNTDYRSCYSAHIDLGGGVRIDLIHEIDYICYLFGSPTEIVHRYGTCSCLEITSEDIATYIVCYPDKLISLHLDYFGRCNRRELELFIDDDVVVADLTHQCVRFLKSGKIIELFQERDVMQKAELAYFLDIINGKKDNYNSIFHAMQTLKMALGEV